MYTGYKELVLSDEDFECLYSNKALSSSNGNFFEENEYLLAKIEGKDEPVDYFKYQNGQFEQVKFQCIKSDFMGEVKPVNPYQRIAIDMLKDSRSKVKLLRGVYGSGKFFATA